MAQQIIAPTSLLLSGENIFACYPCIKAWMSGMDELSQGLKYTLECHRRNLIKQQEQQGLQIPAPAATKNELVNEESTSVHATLFLSQNSNSNVEEACNVLLQNLNLPSIDCLYVAFHPLSTDAEKGKLWNQIVAVCKQGKAKALAVRDLNKSQLEWLISFSDHHPVAISVSLAFAKENDDLVKFAASKGIEVRTHGDTDHLKTFSNQTLKDFMATGKYPFLDNYEAAIDWAISYGVIVTSRQVVKKQSFLFHLALTPKTLTANGESNNNISTNSKKNSIRPSSSSTDSLPAEKKQRIETIS